MDVVDWHSTIAPSFDLGYRRSSAFRERLNVWRTLIARYLPPNGRVLDAGCGTGVLAAVAAELGGHVTGFDGSAAMIDIAKHKEVDALGRLAFHVAALSDILKFGPAKYDLVLSSSVMEYVPGPLSETVRMHADMLQPGGFLIASVPNGNSIWRAFERGIFAVSGRPRYFAHVAHIPRSTEFVAAIKDAGLRIESQQTYAAAPIIGRFARRIGVEDRTDTLRVAVGCRETY